MKKNKCNNFSHLGNLQEDAWVTTPALQALDLSGNRISNIKNNAFNGLSNLTKLDLSHNKFVFC